MQEQPLPDSEADTSPSSFPAPPSRQTESSEAKVAPPPLALSPVDLLGQSPSSSAPNKISPNPLPSPQTRAPQRVPTGVPRPNPKPEENSNVLQTTPPKKSRKKLFWTIFLVLVVAEVGGTFLYRHFRDSQVSAPKADLEVPAPPPQVSEEKAKIARINALAEKLSKDAAEATSMEAPKPYPPPPKQDKKNTAKMTDEPKSNPERPTIYSPKDDQKVAELSEGAPVTMRGVLREIQISNSKNSIYFMFSSPFEGNELRGSIVRKSGGDQLLELSDFEAFIGKTITLDGRLVFKSHMNGHFVEIPAIEKLTVRE